MATTTTSPPPRQKNSARPSPLFVRKYKHSSVIGSRQQIQSLSSSSSSSSSERPMSSQDETRVISCDFKIQVPANALRIDMTMLVSTKNDNNCQEDNPTVFYKITICTPRCKNENHDRINTISELKWSSKFTVAKGKDNTDPFHEWSGSFDLGKKTQIDLTDCCFQQLQGSFSAHYNDSIDSIKKPIPEARQIRKINEASTGATRAMPERKRRRMDAFVQDKRLRI